MTPSEKMTLTAQAFKEGVIQGLNDARDEISLAQRIMGSLITDPQHKEAINSAFILLDARLMMAIERKEHSLKDE